MQSVVQGLAQERQGGEEEIFLCRGRKVLQHRGESMQDCRAGKASQLTKNHVLHRKDVYVCKKNLREKRKSPTAENQQKSSFEVLEDDGRGLLFFSRGLKDNKPEICSD